MQIQQNQLNKISSTEQRQNNQNVHTNNNIQQRLSHQNQIGLNNRNSYQGRPSNQSYMSFGRMSIEQPTFHQNQKISLQSNISAKARQNQQKKDLFQNLANQQRSYFNQELFVRDQGSYKQYDIGHQTSKISLSPQVHYPVFNNFGFLHEQHNHFSSPSNLNLQSQQFKQRSSEGTNTVSYSGLSHSSHNQSQSTIKMKIFQNEIVSNNKSQHQKIQQPVEIQKQPEQKIISCKCPRSKCLLMYCECFSKGIMCNPSCSCYQCRNNPDFQQKRQNARRIVLERDPNAFSNKLQVVGGEQSSELAYKRGCNCKKTNCFKKYCECFYAGVKCTYLCKCQNCMNGGQNAYKG